MIAMGQKKRISLQKVFDRESGCGKKLEGYTWKYSFGGRF